jgi:hypothetical protein
LGALAVLVGSATAQSALAANPLTGQRTDPQAGSPAGVIYQIPLDTGRRDAAPVLPVGSRHSSAGHGDAGAGGGGGEGGGGGGGTPRGGPPRPGGGGTSGTNGGASPTAAAGTSASGGAGTGGASPASATGSTTPPGATPGNPSSIHSENGFGSSAQVPGVSPTAANQGAGVPAAHTPGSTLPSYLLMVLIGMAAVAVGLIAGGRARRPAPR